MLQRLKYEAVEYRLDSVIWTVSTALHPLFPDALQVASIGSLEAALAKVDAEVSVKNTISVIWWGRWSQARQVG